jgi:hypothetical protein
MNHRPLLSRCARAALPLVAWLAAVLVVVGQPLNFGRVKEFMVPDYFDPPHENQLRSRLTGSEAEPMAGGRFVLKRIRLESFRLDGLCEFRITAPEAIYDNARRAAYSASEVHLESGDGRLTVDGRGFLWDQTNSIVVISNDQRTILRPASVAGTNTHR